jgi:transcription elongation factor GreA
MEDITLSDAIARYTETLRGANRQAAIAELSRFQRWYGTQRTVSSLRGHDISLYADVLGPATPETSKRAEQVRSFLAYLKKQGFTEANLAPHLRLRKASVRKPAAQQAAEEPIELTREGIEALKAELQSLIEQRPLVREEIRKAMLDKDFRENAPLDAAKDKQGHMEARIREIESMLKRAVVVEGNGDGERVRVGATVVVTDLRDGSTRRFAIVGPTEANAADGKISSVSPVGKALLDRKAGEEVEVAVPSGKIRYRIEEIAG